MLNDFSNWLRENAPLISNYWATVQLIANLALIPVTPVEITTVIPHEEVTAQVEETIDAQDIYELASNALDAIDASKAEVEIVTDDKASFSGGDNPEEDEEMKSLDEAMECFEEYYYSHGQPQELTQELSAY